RQATEPLPTVVGLRFEGQTRFDPERLRSAFGQVVGAPYEPERIERGIETLWEVFGVRADTVDVRLVPGGVELRVFLTELALDPAPRFVGHVKVKRKEILEWAGLAEGSEVYLHQAAGIVRRLEDGYRRKGYYFADVRAVARGEDLAAGLSPDVTFEILEGPRVRVKEVRVAGNDAFPDRGALFWRTGLRRESRSQLRKPLFFGLFPKYLTDDLVAEDVLGMREYYRRRGYFDAVVQLERLEFTEDRSWVTVHLAVDEGPRYVVESLSVETYGRVADPEQPQRLIEVPVAPALPLERLRELCELAVGEAYNGDQVDRDKAELREAYGALGHVDHFSIPRAERWEFLDPRLEYDLEGTRVRVVYRVVEGRPQRIREVRFQGNLRSQDRVLRREVTVNPGEVADLEEIERSLRRLRGTGYFSSQIDLDHPEPTYRFVETDDPEWKDLEYVVEEGENLLVNFGVQIGSDSGLQGLVDLRLSNFDGRRWPSWGSPFTDIRQREAFYGAGQSLRVSLAPGTEVSQFGITFEEPDLFLMHQDAIGGSVSATRTFRDYEAYEEERTTYGLTLFRALTPETRASVGLRLSNVKVSELDTSAPPSIFEPETVPEQLAAQEPDSDVHGLLLGLSGASFDNLTAPRDAYRWSTSVVTNSELLGSDYDFVEGNVLLQRFQPLTSGRGVGPVLHGRLELGVAVPYGDTDDVPYTERLFLGGTGNLRGFDLRGVGPSEDGYSIGGETLAAARLEYLFPILSRPVAGTDTERELVRGGLFVDAGLIDPEPFQLDFDELRASVGFSFSLPIVLPLTLSFAFPIRDEPGDDNRTLHFTLAY
ncbi:MAG TPA: POTRA domain-containing protein, partial [Planctomycetota bacterium]|nr:POTRA domain-containing protein [Planctomycetota bacterium]